MNAKHVYLLHDNPFLVLNLTIVILLSIKQLRTFIGTIKEFVLNQDSKIAQYHNITNNSNQWKDSLLRFITTVLILNFHIMSQ